MGMGRGTGCSVIGLLRFPVHNPHQENSYMRHSKVNNFLSNMWQSSHFQSFLKCLMFFPVDSASEQFVSVLKYCLGGKKKVNKQILKSLGICS